ncbi:hypothetical protein EII42_01220 [Tessaracoccus sp. OH4464_COT-324]|nr:hypothetical protein EII42_01220 [Tessaracoccus sp. OH4464_COT-324]
MLIGQDTRRVLVAGRSYLARTIRPGQSTKDYRCPGCNQIVRAGVGHVVAWPESAPIGYDSGVELRRHWHTSCWSRA